MNAVRRTTECLQSGGFGSAGRVCLRIQTADSGMHSRRTVPAGATERNLIECTGFGGLPSFRGRYFLQEETLLTICPLFAAEHSCANAPGLREAQSNRGHNSCRMASSLLGGVHGRQDCIHRKPLWPPTPSRAFRPPDSPAARRQRGKHWVHEEGAYRVRAASTPNMGARADRRREPRRSSNHALATHLAAAARNHLMRVQHVPAGAP